MWNDLPRASTVIRLEANGGYVQRFITEEEAVTCPSYAKLVRSYMVLLCEDWRECFGGPPLAIAPKEEAGEWSVYYDNTIDGEVVTKEIEGGDKDATRGCIEGW